MKTIQSKLKDCYVIQFDSHNDDRGFFSKIYHKGLFEKENIDIDIKEQFYTTSGENVVRGMHFQLPPFDHKKLVTCLSGKILDVVLDLRSSSSTYGQFDSFNLTENDGQSVYIPSGIAHGFLSLKENSGVLYSTSEVHEPEADRGVCWDSFGFDWGCPNPILSQRDQTHMKFNQFKTPF
jgi:dTDP-4-dehydrorhamnose 3,5-epimerase